MNVLANPSFAIQLELQSQISKWSVFFFDKLPQSKASLEAVARSLREVRTARENQTPLPVKQHRCVDECLRNEDPVMVDLQL